MVFRDRVDAGRALGRALAAYEGRPDVVVLGLPRGGVPVAEQVAQAIGAPLDVFVVRKLGVPGHPELAMGAIASGGFRVMNPEVVAAHAIDDRAIDRVTEAERIELERRERAYRHGRAPLSVAGKTVILVDDGLATGASMRAAIEALRKKDAGAVVVAVPIGAPETCSELGRVVDDIVCAATPRQFVAVGQWYDDFSDTSDAEVRAALERSRAPAPDARVSELCRRYAQPLTGSANDYDALLAWIGDAEVVLIGEASHGTHEFYRERAQITKRLISEKGFAAVAAEADWPDAYRINRFVRGQSQDAEAVESLAGFARFPAWMWRNADVLDFVGWLREHNDQHPEARAGFYGLDLYSLHASIDAVVAYLDRVDPAAAERARARYACFEATAGEEAGQQYGFAASLGLAQSCEDEVVGQLTELRRHAAEFAGGSPLAEDEYFFAEQNARVAKNAEAYYRAMFHERVSSWNLRDQHMMGTLEALIGHLGKTAGARKTVVWAHNSHLGDARATDMGRTGELNLGQLVREKFGDRARLIGLTTYTGSVTAASAWGAPAERKHVRPALPGSFEALFHATGLPGFLLVLEPANAATRALHGERLERAIGVIYRPDTERASHYFHARLAEQFDAVIHLDTTRALEPLERVAPPPSEPPETFPAGV